MRVLHVIKNLDVGGLEVVVAHLVRQLRHAGVATAICCVEDGGKLAPGIEAEGIRVFCLNKPAGVSIPAIFRLRRIILSEGYDVVHTHNPMGQFYGAFAALGTPAKVLHSRHQTHRDENWRQNLRSQMCAHITHRMVGVSDAVSQCIVEEVKFDRARTSTILNGIDVSPCLAIPQPDGSPLVTIGTIGRLAPVKDQIALLQVFQKLLRQRPELHLRIVGDGESRPGLEDFVRTKALQGSVTFCGYRADIPEQMRAIDLFVMCSISEGMPIVLIEAMACAKPVVATAVGGIPEMLEDGESGLLVPAGDQELLLAAVERLLDNPSLAARLGQRAREVATNRFSISIMANNYIALYSHMTGMRPATG